MRTTKSALAALAAATALALTLAAPVADGGSCDAGATDVLSRQNTGLMTEQFRVIEDEQEWCEVWDQIHSRISPAPDCDTTLVDFDTEVALLAALGSRPNGCYGVSIACVNRIGGSENLRVTVRETVPGKGCVCTQATVSPVAIVKVDRPVGTVDFFKRTAMLRCR